jgi:hypothetical protein
MTLHPVERSVFCAKAMDEDAIRLRGVIGAIDAANRFVQPYNRILQKLERIRALDLCSCEKYEIYEDWLNRAIKEQSSGEFTYSAYGMALCTARDNLNQRYRFLLWLYSQPKENNGTI